MDGRGSALLAPGLRVLFARGSPLVFAAVEESKSLILIVYK